MRTDRDLQQDVLDEVKLEGEVEWQFEKEEAERASATCPAKRAAWSAPGVHTVEDLITIEP